MMTVLVLPILEATWTLLGADVVDDGPMTICETVVTGIIVVDGTIAVGVGLVLSVTVGIPATDTHMFSNVSMMPCAEETMLIEGSSPTAQSMQACKLASMARVQRQLVEVQDATVDSTDEQTEAHYRSKKKN